jgi:hypothetical protein
MYMELSNRLTAGRGVQICAARATRESGGMPGAWRKFYQDDFSEAGLGGQDTPVISGAPHGEAISPYVLYVAPWKRYLCVFALNAFRDVNSSPPRLEHSGVYAATSRNGTHWTKPVRLESIFAMFLNEQECMMHPFVVVKEVRGNRLIGQLMYRYTPKWPDNQGYLAGLPLQIDFEAPVDLGPPKRSEKPQAFVFDGKSTIRTPVKRQVPLSIEMWIKPVAQDKDVFVIGSSSLLHQGLGIGLNKGFLRAQHLIGDFGCGEAIRPGRWYHIAGTFDAKGSHLFLNGKRVASGPGNQTAHDTPEFVIGDIGTLQSGHHFKGAIRSIRLSKSIRYTADFTPPSTFEPDKHSAAGDTLLIYDASSTYDDEVTDLSGNAAHGVRDGVTVAVDSDGEGGARAAKIGRPDAEPSVARQSLADRLKGTKWIREGQPNNVFQWTNDGRLLQNGGDRKWKVLDDKSAEVRVGERVDRWVFADDLKTVVQHGDCGKWKSTWKRSE